MKSKLLKLLVVGVAVIIPAAGSVRAEGPPLVYSALVAAEAQIGKPKPAKPCRGKKCDAPEIDAASGTSAIVLVSVALLLMRERSRSRRRT
ncbi:MAG: VPEID-CTERM sorting domain-containing protein [Gammaproteobacteria bacterium]